MLWQNRVQVNKRLGPVGDVVRRPVFRQGALLVSRSEKRLNIEVQPGQQGEITARVIAEIGTGAARIRPPGGHGFDLDAFAHGRGRNLHGFAGVVNAGQGFDLPVFLDQIGVVVKNCCTLSRSAWSLMTVTLPSSLTWMENLMFGSTPRLSRPSWSFCPPRPACPARPGYH